MPFLIRPRLHYIDADTPQLTYTIIEPDHNERTILRDLQEWGWYITRHDVDDEEFIEAMKSVKKDVKKRRRRTHVIGSELHGYQERLTLEDLWEIEAERALEEDAFDLKPPEQSGEEVEQEIEECFDEPYLTEDAEEPLHENIYEQDNEQDNEQRKSPPATYMGREDRKEKVEKLVSQPYQSFAPIN